MIWRRFSFNIAKYLTIFLCLVTVLSTTPWGTRVTLTLLNNLTVINADYKSGSLIRDLALNTFSLQLENIDIRVKNLSTALDVSCVWKKALCLKSIKAESFLLHYISKESIGNKNATNTVQQKVNRPLFEMPFSIKIDLIDIKESHVNINNTEISTKQLVTQLSIHKSHFRLTLPKIKQLTMILEQSDQRALAANQTITEVINSSIAQLPEINLPIALNIENLQIADVMIATRSNPDKNCQHSCQQKFKTHWLSSSNEFTGSWLFDGVSIQQFQTSTSAFTISQFSAEAKLIPPYQLKTQLVIQLKDVPSWPEIAHSTQYISSQGSFENLVFDITSKGNLVLTSHGKVNLIHKDMPFNVTIDAPKIPMPLSLAQYGQPSSLSAELSGNTDKQNIELTSELNSYGYNNAQVKLIAIHQQGHFNIKELFFNTKRKPNSNNVANQLYLSGNIAIQPNNISWQVTTNSTGITLPEISLTELAINQSDTGNFPLNFPESINGRLQGKLTSKGSWSPSQWAISISDTDIFGQLNNAELNMNGNFGINQSGHLQQGNLFVAYNNSELILQTAGDSFWDLKGKLSIENLNQWHQGVNGSLMSDFSVTGEQDNPVITLQSRITQLTWQQWLNSALTIKASYQPFNNHQIQLTVNNEHLKWQKKSKVIAIDEFMLKLMGNAKQHKIETHWLGDVSGQLVLTGYWNENFSNWQSVIEKSAFTYQHVTLKNDKAFSLDFDLENKQGFIESHCWKGTGVSVCSLQKTTIGRSGDIALNLTLDLTELDSLLLPKDIELISEVGGNIKAQWSEQHPINAKANFSLSSGYIKVSDDFNEHQLSQWSQGDIVLSVNEQKFDSQLLLTDTHDTPLLNINSTLGLTDNYPVNAQVNINQFSLAPFQNILTSVVNLQGNLTAKLAIDGTLDSPLVNGAITLNKGNLVLTQNANNFDNIYTQFAIENNIATIQGNFSLGDKQAKLLGTMSWQETLSFNIDLNAETLPVIFPPQLVMNIAPNLNFHLKQKALIISGDIDVLAGSYNIDKLPEDSVSLSDDVVIIDQHGQTVIKKTTNVDIKTNVRVNIDKTFRISGQGLESHLFGQLQINQAEKQPFQVFGSIQSNEGTFKAYGQKLVIEKGEVTFNGPITNPYLNLRASRHIKAEDINAGIQITGLADTLSMQLFSSPTMTNPEVLSYLVRGRSLEGF